MQPDDPKLSEEAIQLPTSTIEQSPSLSERLLIPTLLAGFDLSTLDLEFQRIKVILYDEYCRYYY